ncbi:unnamed protein product, partial [Hymenolepis diminuta]|uniref:Levansucrase n=1 Tax=Hymenolepis diminuta TaxID=6216 RepID=A0A0R3SZS8_HYMDI
MALAVSNPNLQESKNKESGSNPVESGDQTDKNPDDSQTSKDPPSDDATTKPEGT